MKCFIKDVLVELCVVAVLIMLISFPSRAADGSQPTGMAAGIDTMCQAAIHGHINFKDGKFGKNNPEESKIIQDAAWCVAYIDGWHDGLNLSIIQVGNKLYLIRFAPSFNAQNMAVALHTHLQANPLDNGKPADQILMKIAIDGGVASAYEFKTPCDLVVKPKEQ